MKTCPNCGAPQADSLPTCDLCGFLFPGAKLPKPRFEFAGLIAVISDVLSVIGTLVFFSILWTDTFYYNWRTFQVYLGFVYGSMAIAALGPIVGFIFSLIGLKKTKGGIARGRELAKTGIITSSILLPGSIFYIVIFCIAKFTTVT